MLLEKFEYGRARGAEGKLQPPWSTKMLAYLALLTLRPPATSEQVKHLCSFFYLFLPSQWDLPTQISCYRLWFSSLWSSRHWKTATSPKGRTLRKFSGLTRTLWTETEGDWETFLCFWYSYIVNILIIWTFWYHERRQKMIARVQDIIFLINNLCPGPSSTPSTSSSPPTPTERCSAKPSTTSSLSN